jgi:hypothetical protein
VGSPVAGVDFDRSRLNQGELISGIAGVVLLIDLWFKWYGVNVSGGGGLLKGFSIGVSADAWEVFSVIDIVLFLVALTAIGVAVLRAVDRMPELPFPPATLVAAAGGLAVLLILFRFIDTPVDTNGVQGIDVTRKFGVYLGLLAAAAVTYGGWRSMQETGATWSDLTGGLSGTAPTTAMPATDPGVPGGGAAGVSPGKEGPGVPNPGTSTGGPNDGDAEPTPAAAGADPVPGETAGTTPPGLAGDPPPDQEGTRPAGL